MQDDIEALASVVVDEAYHIHREIGPGLLESVYQKILTASLRNRSLQVETELPVSFTYHGLAFDSELRLDLLVGGKLIVELKSSEQMAPVYSKQLLTYLRLTHRPLGLLINFGLPVFKDGCARVVNGPNDFSTSPLRINQAKKRFPTP